MATSLCLNLTILDIRWPLLFFSETDFIYNYIHIAENWAKHQCGKLKKSQDFCPRDMESCHLAAVRRVKLWSLNANLFLVCVAGVSKNLREGNETGRECEKYEAEGGGEASEGNACNQSQKFYRTPPTPCRALLGRQLSYDD